MRRKPMLAAMAALIVVPTLAACGSSSSDSSSTITPAPAAATATTPTTAAAPAKAGTVNVALSEWAIAPTPASAPAGKVTFDVKNDGKVPHEMVIIKTDKAAGSLGSGSRVPETGSVGEVSDLAPGKSASKTFKLKAGNYVLICNIPGHYMSGMHAAFKVS